VRGGLRGEIQKNNKKDVKAPSSPLNSQNEGGLRGEIIKKWMKKIKNLGRLIKKKLEMGKYQTIQTQIPPQAPSTRGAHPIPKNNEEVFLGS